MRAIVDSLFDDSPIGLVFPSTDLISHAAFLEYVDAAAVAPGKFWWSEALLSLFHCFDCQRAMQRSEQVILRGHLSACHHAWYWLSVAVSHMKAVEGACIEKLGRDKDVGKRLDDEEFLDTLRELPAAVIGRVMAAMTSHLTLIT